MPTVKLTFYGGVNEIGGNKVLVEDHDTRILVDFGLSYGRRARFYDEFLNPRPAGGLSDFLKVGLVPDLRGTYRDDLLATIGRNPEEPVIDAVLLSHAHMDHASYISFLNEKIPVHCGETCKFILEAIQESSDRDIEREILAFKPRPINHKSPEIPRTISTFRTGAKIAVGDLTIEPIHVDHSIPGDYGFIISTSEGNIVYTSDLRMHGNHPELTEDFVKAAQSADPVALICEGTRIDDAKADGGEAGVKKGSNSIIHNCKELVVADFNFKDVDRLHTFLDIARANGRKLAISLKDAYFLKHLHPDPKLGLPAPDNDDILIILPKRNSGNFLPTDYGVNDRQFFDYPNVVKPQDLTDQQGKIIACLGFYDMGTISDIDPIPGSLYIHSSSEAYNEEMVLDLKRLKNWTDFLDMKYYQSHASGHAGGHEIMELIRRVNPKTLFPVHTESPESFRGTSDHTVITEVEKNYPVR